MRRMISYILNFAAYFFRGEFSLSDPADETSKMSSKDLNVSHKPLNL